MDTFDIIFLTIIALMVIGMINGIFYERRVWNNGICSKTGKAWEYFDTDSQGGRGYSSDDENNHYTCWMTWGWDIKKNVEV